MRQKPRIAIIGAGPAGIAAAIQLTRSGFAPMIFEQGTIGGLLRNAHWIENYPGFPAGISGNSLVRYLQQHMKAWKITVKKERVHSLSFKKPKFVIRAQRVFYADLVIIASGTKPVTPDIDTMRFRNQILFGIAPIYKCQDKRIIIVGAGDAAYDYALHCGQFNKVLLVNRTRHTKALTLLVRRARRARNIAIVNNSQVTAIGKMSKDLQVVLTKKNRRLLVACDYLIYAIGREPALDFLSPKIKKKFPHGDRTTYFIGDVKNGNTRQVAIAVGDGVKAAMVIARRYLSPCGTY